MMAVILLVSAVGVVVGAVLLDKSHVLAYCMGVVAGMLGSILRVVVLERGVKAALEKNPRDADNYMKLNSFTRLGIAAASLGLALWLLQDYGFYGAAVGILAMSVAAHVVGMLPGAKENRELLKRVQAPDDASPQPDTGNHPEAPSGDA